ncbi:heparinase II/III family protein [Paenibacillus humicola]|uniref:heparinase II/III family protein n=1 Tax=Paenibacillus humicola TaxID=3110540 RepID=UPI00237A256F|nr:heparinase II/III family protein [Paenibacillus humicola]
MPDLAELRAALAAGSRPPRGSGVFPFLGAEQVRRALQDNADAQPLLAGAAAAAERYAAEPVPRLAFSQYRLFATTGDRLQYQQVYFARRGRLRAFAAAALATGESRWTEPLQDMIWDICDEYTWCLPAHLSKAAGSPPPPQTVDLFAAETTQALAEIAHLLGDRLDPAVTERARDEIMRRVLRPIEERPFPAFGWETADHNWAAVCAGSAGMAALLLMEDRERLVRFLERSLRTMDHFLSGYGEDGGCAEGVGYWEYGFGYYVYFADLLHACTGGAIDLLAGGKIKAIARFPETAHLSEGVFANYSDSAERTSLHPGLLSRLAQRTGRSVTLPFKLPDFHDDHCYRWAPFIRNLVWTDRSRFAARRGEGLQTLPDLAWFIDRRELGGSAAAFSAKGGHNDEPHNHNDLGHFLIHAGGETILSDLGHGLYTKDYFSDKRYTILNNASAGHSVPVAGGCEQAAGRAHRAEVLHAAELPGGSELRLDLTSAYPKEARLTRFVRSFRWDRDAGGEACRLALEDAYRFDGGPGAWEERFVSRIRPAPDGGSAIVWETERARLTLRFDAGRLAPEIAAVPHAGADGRPFEVYLTKLAVRKPEAEAAVAVSFELTMKDKE